MGAIHHQRHCHRRRRRRRWLWIWPSSCCVRLSGESSSSLCPSNQSEWDTYRHWPSVCEIFKEKLGEEEARKKKKRATSMEMRFINQCDVKMSSAKQQHEWMNHLRESIIIIIHIVNDIKSPLISDRQPKTSEWPVVGLHLFRVQKTPGDHDDDENNVSQSGPASLPLMGVLLSCIHKCMCVCVCLSRWSISNQY